MPSTPRVALFIDCENASPNHAQKYLDHSRSIGRLAIARCYGSAGALKGWESVIAKHHLIPVQTPPGAAKANASDFALTIDAVSLLHRDMFDHAVIASSDADFILLVIHIREHGKGIDGIGEAKAKAAFRSAFDTFTLVSATAAPIKGSEPKAAAKKAALPAAKPASPAAIDKEWLLGIFDATRKASSHCDIQALGRALAAANADYKKGHRTLDNYLRKSGLFEIRDRYVHRTA